MSTTPEVCEPADAYTDVIVHPAEGEPTLIIDNPDYIPATDGYYEEVANPDYVPPTDGYNITKDKLLKWTWTGGPIDTAPVSPIIDPTGWNAVGETNDKKGRNNPDQVIQAGKGNADYFYYQTQLVWIDGTPAQGEPTLQQWVEGLPAQGEPTLEVVNPDYKASWTEYIDHEATVCEVEQPDTSIPWTPLEPSIPVDKENPITTIPWTPLEPSTPVEPIEPPTEVVTEVPIEETVAQVVHTKPADAQPDALALTGGLDLTGLALGATFLVAAGVTLLKKTLGNA